MRTAWPVIEERDFARCGRNGDSGKRVVEQRRKTVRKEEVRGWLLVASLFVTLAIVWGVGYDIIGVFFHPLHKDYGWSRTQLSLLATSLSISYGVSMPLIGWLLDRIDARVVIGFGAATVGVALASASRADPFPILPGSYFLLPPVPPAPSILPPALLT